MKPKSAMSRLADYFVLIGYDHERGRSGEECGKIIQRFPQKDWENCPLTPGIEMFCQPSGWGLTTQRLQPTFFVSVLTDTDADQHYCACLTFHEDVVIPSNSSTSTLQPTEEENASSLVRSAAMYAPKSLVLVSRLDCFETFRNCLGLIYTVYIENSNVDLEALIGNMLGCIQVPPPGGPQVRFSIGAGDRQALQPPLSSTLPVTHTAVAMLFKHLGIANCISVFCAALTDHKILFHSQSYKRLTEASHAVTALMYPLKYSYVYVPILPSRLLEVLSTPTPFIAGVHSSLQRDVSDLLDVIIADLDGGSIKVPEHIHQTLMPEQYYEPLLHSLYLIMVPELLIADCAFPTSPVKTSSPIEMLDKEIRAVFLRFFAELFFGYRSCLTIVRIHPEPVIRFHKANFLGHRQLVDDDFTVRMLDSMSFNTFVADKGPPYRVCDLFDEVFASMQDTLKTEETNPNRLLHNIRDLAQQLYSNEIPNPQPYVQKVQQPTDGAYMRVHQPVFPKIDERRVHDIIEEGIAKHNLKSKLSQMRPMQARIVPIGPHIAAAQDRVTLVSTNARRLEVLRNCVNFIFENKISDARKIFPAVLKAMKSKLSRLALVEELSYHIQSNRAQLEHQQFDLVVRLLNSALQNDSSMDEHGIAASILPLATSFCRKLCTGVLQFAYTCIQEHAVWANHQFWEAAFYQDVEQQIRQLYLPQYEMHLEAGPSPTHGKDHGSGWKSSTTPESKRRSVAKGPQPREISALEIAAEQMRVWPSLGDSRQGEMVSNEESTVYSQAIHYANRMVYMRVPLDASKHMRDTGNTLEGESTNSNLTSNSVAESDSFDAESGFDEQEVQDVGASVIKFVTRFVDKVCTECGVTSDHIKALHQMIPGVVAMHIEILEAVHQESKRLPPIQKPKILTPTLLPGEEVIMDGMRVYLVPDGREEGTGGNQGGGPTLLPAEGAVFLTTYRIIFKGTPCDPLACEQIVNRSFPVSTLMREKKISVQYLAHEEQPLIRWLQDGLQLRSNTFQLMRIAFDEEVNSEDVETLRKLVCKVRYPPSVINTFAFTGFSLAQPSQYVKAKEKNASLKGYAKRTLMKTAKKVGLKSKTSQSNKQKLLMTTPPTSRRGLPGMDFSRQTRPASVSYDDELSVIDEQDMSQAIQSDAKSVERLAERAYCRDYCRMGLGSLSSSQTRARMEPYRLSMVNNSYSICKSYPAVLVVPQSVSDDSIRKFARSHRQYRFPVVSWRHPTTRAVLLRASGFHGKGVMEMLKGKQNTPAGTTGSESSTSLEQEKYFSALVAATPMGNQRFTVAMSDSLTSLDSLLLSAATGGLDPHHHLLGDTPELARKNPLARAVINLRSSGGKAKYNSTKPVLDSPSMLRKEVSSPGVMRRFGSFRKSFQKENARPNVGSPTSLGRASSAKERPVHHRVSTSSMSSYTSALAPTPKQNGSLDLGELTDVVPQGLHRASLYVMGEKTQVKGIKLESFPSCDFIPVDYSEVRHVKSSFKKLSRACVPSSPSGTDKGFLHLVEESEWLNQLQTILQIAGATVDLLDVQGSSVMICLEDGWDFTTQVVSVAQLLLDPYYRTFEGFRTLVEKEWLSYGHRFTHRSNQTMANQASGFAPIFLQFLDVIHQIHLQFPLSFEFNQYFLKFLAYHSVSNRFRTFMLDNEFERMEAGWLLNERSQDLQEPNSVPGAPNHLSPRHGGLESTKSTTSLSSSPMRSMGSSMWDYIDLHNSKSPVFYNFMFSPMDQETVLRPYSNLSSLKVWQYFTEEHLAYGPSFDFEIFAKEVQLNEDPEQTVEGAPVSSVRTIVNGCYDTIEQKQPDACTYMLSEIEHLHADLDTTPERWHHLWDKLENPSRDQLQRQVSFNTQIVRSHGRSIHKRSTIELLVKGKLLGEAAKIFAQAHHFDKFTYTTPANCDYCSHVLWGLVKTEELPVGGYPQIPLGMRCSDCGYNCHERCMPHAPKNCTRLQPVAEARSSTTSIAKASMAETASLAGETRTHEGYLFKRGALLKGWKQRWFVLDSMKHQLRYYDSQEDGNCKGFIDLADVESVQLLKNVQGAPKKADDKAFFELKTTRRLYNFLASDAKAANDWIEKVQNCIQ